VVAGEVAHKWQPCSTSEDTIVKCLQSQPWFYSARQRFQVCPTEINLAACPPQPQ
jgi:hypothetical protein